MDLHQLFVFTKVVEHKSFSKAADDIFLSQSTVSSHIQSLEKELNLHLFDRVGRESILTPHGERLYEWALRILRLKDEALLDLKQGLTELKGSIRITSSSVPVQFIVPKMVKRFREEFSGVTFHINQTSSKTVADKVMDGSADIGIIGEKYESDKLCYIPLRKEKLVLITSNQLEINSPFTIHDIKKYPFIMRNSDSGTDSILQKFLLENQISKDDLNIIAYTDGPSLIQFVIQNIGISIISEIAANEYLSYKKVKLHHINGFDTERYFYLVYNKNKTLSLLSKLFINKASDLAKDL